MRRYISLFCVCLVFMMCLGAPVKAASDPWYSVFDGMLALLIMIFGIVVLYKIFGREG